MFNMSSLELQQLYAFSEAASKLGCDLSIFSNTPNNSKNKKRKPSKKKLKVRNKNKMSRKSRKKNRRK